VFIGLAERDREECITALLDCEIPVRLGGKGWRRFLRRHVNHPRLQFEGEEIFGDRYAALLSGSRVGLGLISKRIPELHTTRTFEIPACGGVLATESTSDTARFYDEGEALFFSTYHDLALRLRELLDQPGQADLRAIAAAGRARLLRDHRDYPSIMREILDDPRLFP
jgi:spore maturation protein CgeB